MDWRPISADSHITEPPECYRDHIEPAFRERAPHVVRHDSMGDIYIVDGMKAPVPMGLVAAAGVAPKDIRVGGAKFEDLHRSGWDPSTRLQDQDRDGVAAEIIYPTVGMLICNHPDFDYKKAASTPTTGGCRPIARIHPIVSSAWARRRCARWQKALRTFSASRRWDSGAS